MASWHLLRWDEERGGLAAARMAGPILPSETLPSAVMEDKKEEVVVEMGGDILKVAVVVSLVLEYFETDKSGLGLGFDLTGIGLAKSRVSVWG